MLAAQLGCLLLAGAQGLFTLPQRYGKHLAALTVDEEIDPLKALHLLEAGHDVLLSVAEAIVYLVWRTLVGGYTRKHVTSFIPRVPYQSGCAQGIKAGWLTLLPRIRLLRGWGNRGGRELYRRLLSLLVSNLSSIRSKAPVPMRAPPEKGCSMAPMVNSTSPITAARVTTISLCAQVFSRPNR